jgi:hypothetical protein
LHVTGPIVEKIVSTGRSEKEHEREKLCIPTIAVKIVVRGFVKVRRERSI